MDFALKNIIANNDYLMIKGSNATGLNNLSKRIIKGFKCYLLFNFFGRAIFISKCI